MTGRAGFETAASLGFCLLISACASHSLSTPGGREIREPSSSPQRDVAQSLRPPSKSVKAIDKYRARRHSGQVHVGHKPRKFVPVDTSGQEVENEDSKGQTAQGVSCGKERWNVKTLTDPESLQEQASLPNLLLRVIKGKATTTVDELISRTPPNPWLPEMPRQSDEGQLQKLAVYITEYKLEADHDYHIVIIDAATGTLKTMIAEVPDPACMGGNPGGPTAIPDFSKKLFGDARNQFTDLVTHHGGPAPQPQLYKIRPPIKIFVSGFVFYDKIHGQDGVAPNGIEIHPVLDIEEDVSAP